MTNEWQVNEANVSWWLNWDTVSDALRMSLGSFRPNYITFWDHSMKYFSVQEWRENVHWFVAIPKLNIPKLKQLKLYFLNKSMNSTKINQAFICQKP